MAELEIFLLWIFYVQQGDLNIKYSNDVIVTLSIDTTEVVSVGHMRCKFHVNIIGIMIEPERFATDSTVLYDFTSVYKVVVSCAVK